MKLLTIPAHKIIGVSPSATKYLTEKLKVNKSKVVLINNGVALPQEFEEYEIQELKKQLNIKEGQIVIGTVGRMKSDEHKRFSDLIKAFAILINKGLNLKMVLVSGGPLIATYQKLVDELKIQEHVVFTGYQNQTSKYYSIFDIFSLVSAYEAFGLVLAEAMLHKLPVVATRVGGMQYIVDDNETGYLVERFNVESIAAHLEMLCINKELRLKFGNNGFKKAMINYTEERYVRDVENLYLELIKQNKVVVD